MKLRLDKLVRSDLELLKENCNFTEDESKLFELIAKGYMDVQMSYEMGVCTSTVTKKKRVIRRKIIDFLEVFDMTAVIYVDGKRVSEDDVKNFEIHIERVKELISGKLTKGDE
jgi:FixJ family two-component response regulator